MEQKIVFSGNQIIFSAIPFNELLSQFREMVREEISHAPKPSTSAADLKYLSRQEVADLFKITLPTLKQWTREGKVKAHRIGRRVLYTPQDVQAALKQINTNQIGKR